MSDLVKASDVETLPGREERSQPVEALARLSFTLPRSLARQLRLQALERDTTLSALVARLIRQELR